jgi:hypothetical protein
MKYQNIFFFLALTAFSLLNAQESYKVVYDYQTDELSYFQLSENGEIKEELQSPGFKRNSSVEIELKNVNPFAVEANVDFTGENTEDRGTGFSFGSLLSGFGGFKDFGIQLDPGGNTKSRGAGNESWSNADDMAIRLDAVLENLKSDMADPNLSKEEILQNLKEGLSEIKDPRLNNPNINFYLFLSNLKAVVQSNKSEMLNDLEESLKKSGDETLISRGAASASVLQRNEIEDLTAGLNLKINSISDLYAMLEKAEFEKVYHYNITDDKTKVELKFTTAGNSNDSKELRKRELKLISKGGWKIDTGVTLPLTNFSSSSRDFYIDGDGIIQADKNNNFVPNIGMMINFYPYLSENFNFGGSFGVAIPFTEDFKGINFLLGPSVHVGGKNRFSISGGIAFGPVKKLSNGLKAGNQTELVSLDDYLKTVYDIGWFIGLSFNLFGMKQ